METSTHVFIFVKVVWKRDCFASSVLGETEMVIFYQYGTVMVRVKHARIVQKDIQQQEGEQDL